MSTRTPNYLDAIEHLPEGAILVFHDVSWNDYEELLEDISPHGNFRLSYDCGRLEIVSSLQEHEKYATFISRIMYFLSEELDLVIEGYGSATWKRKKSSRGAEADACFYVANAERVMRKRKFNLESDPAPDIVVEVDIKNESLNKFPIYATLGVPEIWHYDGKTVRFFQLGDDSYREIHASRSFPALSPAMLATALERCKNEGQTAALRAFQHGFRKRQK